MEVTRIRPTNSIENEIEINIIVIERGHGTRPAIIPVKEALFEIFFKNIGNFIFVNRLKKIRIPIIKMITPLIVLKYSNILILAKYQIPVKTYFNK